MLLDTRHGVVQHLLGLSRTLAQTVERHLCPTVGQSSFGQRRRVNAGLGGLCFAGLVGGAEKCLTREVAVFLLVHEIQRVNVGERIREVMVNQRVYRRAAALVFR